MQPRKPRRLSDFNYNSVGMYFVTVCSHQRECSLGRIHNGKFYPSPLGLLTEKYWLEIPQHNPGVALYDYVVMPNHFHGLILIGEAYTGRGLSRLVGGFKSAVSREYHRQSTSSAPVWQTSFHDHVVRNEADLARIREYVANNRLKWELDCYHASPD
ncbi:transposase [Oceanobacter mangrovi]|uniref:transposase n=1 Tax=Oceanobacter mangrovi TaxID=2862510 RepID=UPI001C8ED6E2|nr:transposase [Oceanobacter mangrovi]